MYFNVNEFFILGVLYIYFILCLFNYISWLNSAQTQSSIRKTDYSQWRRQRFSVCLLSVIHLIFCLCCFMEAQSGKKRFICFHLGVWISRCWCLNVCLLYWVSVEMLFFFALSFSCELKLLSHVNGSFKGLGHRGCRVIDDGVSN